MQQQLHRQEICNTENRAEQDMRNAAFIEAQERLEADMKLHHQQRMKRLRLAVMLASGYSQKLRIVPVGLQQ